MTKSGITALIAAAALSACSGIQGGPAKIIPGSTAMGGRSRNSLAAPLLYKKIATIGHGWDEIASVTVNESGDVFAATYNAVKEVIPPFTEVARLSWIV